MMKEDIWEIVFKEDAYPNFKRHTKFENDAILCNGDINFYDNEKKIVFSGKLVSYSCWMSGVFNFNVGIEEKWLRVFHCFIETINGIPVDNVVRYEKQIIYEEKMVPVLQDFNRKILAE